MNINNFDSMNNTLKTNISDVFDSVIRERKKRCEQIFTEMNDLPIVNFKFHVHDILSNSCLTLSIPSSF